jgi:hypothetical protein
MYAGFERLGDVSAAVNLIEIVKERVSHELGGRYQSRSHTTPDTSDLVWRVYHRVVAIWDDNYKTPEGKPPKARTDLLAEGEKKLRKSSMATFNKKLATLAAGQEPEVEEDEIRRCEINTSGAQEDESES